MPDSRVTPGHLNRDASLYIRQSTLRQVVENGESTRRQYALRNRAAALGWASEHIHVIDQDLGQSGAYSEGRDGFQELVAAVGLRKVGMCSAWRYRAWPGTQSAGSTCCSFAPIRAP